MMKRFYGNKYEEVIKHRVSLENQLRNNFFTKYPSADSKKFSFTATFKQDGSLAEKVVWFLAGEDIGRFDITGDGFLNNKEYTQFLYWPRGWSTNGTVQTLKPNGIQIDLNKLLVFITETKSFHLNLDPQNTSYIGKPTINILTEPFDYINNPWFTRLGASYVCGYLCGLSQEHLQNKYSRSKSNIITSIVRYHFTMWMRRFLKQPKLLSRYLTSDVIKDLQKHIPYTEHWTKHYSSSGAKLNLFRKQLEDQGKIVRNFKFVLHGNMGASTTYEEFTWRHYKNRVQDFIPSRSNGLTTVGQKMFQQSLESYIYTILGAQARTRWSIVDQGAKSYQTQEVFGKLFEDQTVQTDITSGITNMRIAIKNTNVRLDFAISPGMILCSSDLRINTQILGFNNVLTVATKFMSFGGNSSINIKQITPTHIDTKVSPQPTDTKVSPQPADTKVSPQRMVGFFEPSSKPVPKKSNIVLPLVFVSSIATVFALAKLL